MEKELMIKRKIKETETSQIADRFPELAIKSLDERGQYVSKELAIAGNRSGENNLKNPPCILA